MRALGPVLEDHLQLLLPALNRLIVPGASGLPLAVQEETLAAMQDLLPRMQLSGFSSAVLHPLIRLLDGPSEELRERALDTLCSVALAIGPDFAIFVPTMKKVGGWVGGQPLPDLACGDPACLLTPPPRPCPACRPADHGAAPHACALCVCARVGQAAAPRAALHERGGGLGEQQRVPG